MRISDWSSDVCSSDLTNIVMGLYVHSGYEFMPRWWNRSWATKWFITATFHDQHHRFFTGNYGGYTTIWDRLCGTMRPRFEADFDTVKARSHPVPAVSEAQPTQSAARRRPEARAGRKKRGSKGKYR